MSELTGPDAADFLHRVSTADVHSLAPGAGTPAFLLDERGRALASYFLWKIDANRFFLEFDPGVSGEWQESIHRRIETLTFSERMSWSAVVGPFLWIFQSEESALARYRIEESPEGLLLNHGSQTFGRPWSTFIPAQDYDLRAGSDFEGAEETTAKELDAWRVEALSWWPGRECGPGELTPLELGATDAVASNKGCYPGQEVIEKMTSIGSPPRKLARLALKGANSAAPTAHGLELATLSPGSPAVGKLGTLTDGRALAVIQKICAKVGVELLARPPRDATTEGTGLPETLAAFVEQVVAS